jgi:hypothetical protein
MTKFAACNIVGPDGVTVMAGMPIPPEWPEELVTELEGGGGVVSGEVDETALEAATEGDES